MLLQRLLESIDLSFGITGRGATLGFSSEVLLCFSDEQSRRPVPHLGVIEGLGEFFDLPVPVSNWAFETPERRNRTVNQRRCQRS